MTIDTRDVHSNIPELKLKGVPKPTIEEWRAQKAREDRGRDAEFILGCVGKPLVEYLEEAGILEKIDGEPGFITACEDARGNLLDMLNEQRSEAYGEALGDAEGVCGLTEARDVLDGLDLGTMTLEEAVEAGRDDVSSRLECASMNGWECRELRLEDIT